VITNEEKEKIDVWEGKDISLDKIGQGKISWRGIEKLKPVSSRACYLLDFQRDEVRAGREREKRLVGDVGRAVDEDEYRPRFHVPAPVGQRRVSGAGAGVAPVVY